MAREKRKPRYGYNFARTHKETEFDALDLAVKLRKKVAHYVMNEKYVPKKWRYFDGKPAVDYARNLRDCISWANDIKIGTADADPEKVAERLDYQERALRFLNLLHFQLMDIEDDCEGATDGSLTEIADIMNQLVEKLNNWHKKDLERAESAGKTQAQEGQ